MYSKFRNRVMFPITNEAGRVIAFTGRTLSTDEKAGPKYLNSPETPIYSKSRLLFNLDQAKEAIRKLDYAILVEGQMDCISVFAAGFHNVIASSGTAFTELQARLLARFTRNVIVNFDPDTAGAKATERTLGLLVEEEFQVRVVTLESGFDPDLFIRRKGKDAYAGALKNSQKYFDYLIERARTQFPVRSAEGKVKAVNYLLPHIQRVPSRIVRDELAREMAQKLGIDSSVLRQELKHAAANRSTAALKAPAEAQITDAEKILIRALVSATEMQTSREHVSARDGAEEEFDPCRQAQFALKSEGLHQGVAAESLIEVLLAVGSGACDRSSLARRRSQSAGFHSHEGRRRALGGAAGRRSSRPSAHPTKKEAGAGAAGAASNTRPGSRPDTGTFGGKDEVEACPHGPQPGGRQPFSPDGVSTQNLMKLNALPLHLILLVDGNMDGVCQKSADR